jgi:hypothetical protein
VQFVNVTATFRVAISQILRGLPVAPPAAAAPPDDSSDPAAQSVLSRYPLSETCDPYALFGLSFDVECSEIRRRARAAMQELEALRSLPLSRLQRKRVESLSAQVKTAWESCATPARRAAYDAHKGNHLGVASCLAAGLTATEIEDLQRKFFEQHPTARGNSHVHALCARAHASEGSTQLALSAYERALRLNPLDLELHRSYRALLKAPAKRSSSRGAHRPLRLRHRSG